jgi:hypothetical protein
MSWKYKKILTIVVGLVACVLFLVVGTKEFTRSKQLAAHGKTTEGEVTVVEDAPALGRRSGHYYLRVKFQMENQGVCEERVRVAKTVYQTVKEGDAVQVHYLAEDPTNCQIGTVVELRYGNILWGIVFIFAAGYTIVNFRQPVDESETAENIDRRVKTLELEHFEYISVKAENFKNVDLTFYNTVQKGLEGHGFVYLDDQENVTLRQRSNLHTFLRYLLGADQSTMAIIYHFARSLKSSKVLDLETWFSDGSFVCTSNAEMAGKLDSHPAIGALYMPSATTWEELLETHQHRVNAYIESHPGTTPVKLNGMADIRRAQAEQQRIKSEFRKKTGLTKAEIERIAGRASPILDRIHGELTERRERGE